MAQNQSPTRPDAPEQDKPKAEPQQPMQSPSEKAEPQGKPQNQS